MKQVNVKTPTEMAAEIPDGATIALTGSGTLLLADDIFAAIEQRFLNEGHPCNLTLIHALGIGDGKGRGLSRFAHKGMVRRVIGGHWSWSSEMQELARNNEIEAYTFPAGVISTLFRESGAGRPGVITKVGLETFADPEVAGGKCSDKAVEDLVERIIIDGETWLRYKPLKVDFGIVRGSGIDKFGNLTTGNEPCDLDAFAVALVACNSGGKVFAQAREMLEQPILPARLVTIPGTFVDAVTLVPEQRQSDDHVYDPAVSGEVARTGVTVRREPQAGPRGIISARAARELKPGMTVNYGFGIPSGVSPAADPKVVEQCWELVEQGLHSGDLLDGPMFGAARYPAAIISSSQQFDFFAGGGLDIAFLGMGEASGNGDVNVSMLGPSVVGPGGFMEISTGARKLVFCGTFETGGLRASDNNGSLVIEQAGRIPKLTEAVRHVTFNGHQAMKRGQEVLYVTERCVFRLTDEGMLLEEVAPGVDIQSDILDRMQFSPIIKTPKPMPLG